MIDLRLDVTLTIDGPFNTQSAGAAGYGVDAALQRNREGNPIIPGSQFKGRLRDALEEVAAAIETDAQLMDDLRQMAAIDAAASDRMELLVQIA